MFVQIAALVSLETTEVLALKLDISRKTIDVWFRDPNLNVLPICFKDVEPPVREQDLKRALAELTAIISRRRPTPMTSVLLVHPMAQEAAE